MTNETNLLMVGLQKNLELHDLRRGLISGAKARIDATEKQLWSLERRKKSEFEQKLLTSSAEMIKNARTCLINLDGDLLMSNKSFLESHDLLETCIMYAQIGLASMAAWHGSVTGSARKKANILHSLPGGSREKQQRIREIWASGKYSNRDTCAEQECGALGMSFSTARKALRNTPAPA